MTERTELDREAMAMICAAMACTTNQAMGLWDQLCRLTTQRASGPVADLGSAHDAPDGNLRAAQSGDSSAPGAGVHPTPPPASDVSAIAPTDWRLALAHALSTLEIGRQFIDTNQQERDNWKGHARIVEDEIKAALAAAPATSPQTGHLDCLAARKAGGTGPICVKCNTGYPEECLWLRKAPGASEQQEAVAWLLLDQRFRAPDDGEDYERVVLPSEIEPTELERFKKAGRADPLVLAAPPRNTVFTEPHAGAWRWIEDACDKLRRANGQLPTGCVLWGEIDSLLSGVPCPQEDLGFDSPADREARRTEERRIPADAAQDLLTALQRIVALSQGYPLLQAELDIPLALAAIAKATQSPMNLDESK